MLRRSLLLVAVVAVTSLAADEAQAQYRFDRYGKPYYNGPSFASAPKRYSPPVFPRYRLRHRAPLDFSVRGNGYWDWTPPRPRVTPRVTPEMKRYAPLAWSAARRNLPRVGWWGLTSPTPLGTNDVYRQSTPSSSSGWRYHFNENAPER